jgi:hypothetical protein
MYMFNTCYKTTTTTTTKKKTLELRDGMRGGCAAVSRERRWKEEEQRDTRNKKIDKGEEIESWKQNGNTSLNLISTISFN